MLSSRADAARTRPEVRAAAPIRPTRPLRVGAAAPTAPVSNYDTSTLRRLALLCGLALLFSRLSVLPEIIQHTFGVKTYLLYVFGPPALLGAVLSGGVQRSFSHRITLLFLGFFGWMVLSVPFSSWIGGSIERVVDYGRFNIPMILITAGLVVNWREVRLAMMTLAASGLAVLLVSPMFVEDKDGRFQFEASGIIGNSNDLAAHLLLLLPFILYIVIEPGRNIVTRLVLLASMTYGFWVILGTASRGALIAIVVSALFLLIRSTMRQRLAIVFAGTALFLIVFMALPGTALKRLFSLTGKEQVVEAEQSANTRGYLFRKSVEHTLTHPVFGVGPDQFSTFEGLQGRKEGKHGVWNATHCSWTQVSSECGIPALLMFLAAVIGTMFTVNKVWKRARSVGHVHVQNACLCYLLGFIAFSTAVTFLSQAYNIYFPVMIGLGASLASAATRELNTFTPRPAVSGHLGRV